MIVNLQAIILGSEAGACLMLIPQHSHSSRLTVVWTRWKGFLLESCEDIPLAGHQQCRLQFLGPGLRSTAELLTVVNSPIEILPPATERFVGFLLRPPFPSDTPVL
jgi:hypothetical protein